VFPAELQRRTGVITVRAGGKDRQGEPDPAHFERFYNVVVPEMLTDVCHVSTELAAQTGEDILARAESYAMLMTRHGTC
jgi:hypothetical protein